MRTEAEAQRALTTWLGMMLKQRYWSQADLARELGVEPSQVSKWVRGTRTPDVAHCRGIADAFAVPACEALALAGRVPSDLRIPTSHPVRDRLHLLIDRVDPEVLEPFAIILQRYMAALDTARSDAGGRSR